jgi:hypothetical protein
MKTATRSRLAVIALVASAVFLSVCGRASNQTASPVASASTNFVYLDLAGDPKLVHRFRMYAEDEFEDAGLALTNDPKQASVTVSVELSSDSRTTEIGNGLVEIVATAGGVKTDLTQCGSSTSDPNGAVFDSGAKSAAAEIHNKFPTAHSVYIDEASNFDAAPEFKAAFESALRNDRVEISESKAADVVTTMRLERRKLSVEETVVNYHIEIVRSGNPDVENSSGVRSAKLVGELPKSCSGSLDDLSWLESNSVPDVVRRIAHNISTGRPK